VALADYFHRSAVAAAQVLGGYDEEGLRGRLGETSVGVFVSNEADCPEGRALVDLTIRLLARLYPTLALEAGGSIDVDALADLARSINPAIDTVSRGADAAIAIGGERTSMAPLVMYAGSDAWNSRLSSTTPQRLGTSENPFGAGAAACLACANLFRAVFRPMEPYLDDELGFSTLELRAQPSSDEAVILDVDLGESVVLVGLGAIGNAAAWALSHCPVRGAIRLVDGQSVDLGNLQRYVLATRDDEHRAKVSLAADCFGGDLHAVPQECEWAQYVSQEGGAWERVLVALDSAASRRSVQATLPRWIANSWTQPGDLGVSVHPALECGACLSCLYLPAGQLPSEDELIASALGVPHETRGLQIRQVLHANAPAPRDLLEEAATSLEIPFDSMLRFEDRPLRELYVEGICGGALLPMDRIGVPDRALHVPLAHQSALAGVLLASRLLADTIGRGPKETAVTRLDILRKLPEYPTQPAQKDPRGICICQDSVYRAAYEAKYPPLEA
jgi:hypothetical protein